MAAEPPVYRRRIVDLTHRGYALGRPVRAEKLAGIPWLAPRALGHLAQQLAVNGPHQVRWWRRIVARADVVLMLLEKESKKIENDRE